MSTPPAPDRRRAGESIEDHCRVCKTDRIHTIVAVDANGWPLRVTCGYCGSDHHYRGGPRIGASNPAPTAPPATPLYGERRPSDRAPFPIVADRERTADPMTTPPGTAADLELLLRRVIREEAGISAVVPAEKWRGGTLVLRPGNSALQEKTIPIETFFHKIVMLRNRLRTLEQQVNASELPDDVKIRLQSYVSGCYGSLTTFNVLFADEADHFKGAGGD
ncbi:MAG: hypothetical protein IT184_15565 [Acidobacteria bacterium]|nr:hypothetical protein [Acidobacteriota bacterium]